MKRSRTRKGPWIKSKTKPGLIMKNIDEFHLDRRQNLAESDKGSWFNEPPTTHDFTQRPTTHDPRQLAILKAMQLVLHLWIYQHSVRKHNGKQKKAMFQESDFQKRVRIILRRRILHCTKRMPPCIFETALRHFLLGLVLFCGSTFFSFRFVLCWPRLKRESPSIRAALAPRFVFVLTKDVAFVSFYP